jgi:hypothetical protein
LRSVARALTVFLLCAVGFLAPLSEVRADSDELYCGPEFEATIKQDFQRSRQARREEIPQNFRDPNSFDNMFCGMAMNNAFAGIMSSVGMTSIFDLINARIMSMLQQICQDAISLRPINIAGLASNIANLVCPSVSANACSLVGMENYIAIIQRVDPSYLRRIYADPRSVDMCYFQNMIIQWLNLNPKYLQQYCRPPTIYTPNISLPR